LQTQPLPAPRRIFAPYHEDYGLDQAIRDLRAQGHSVLQQLPGQTGDDAQALGCTAVLEQDHANWLVKPLTILE